MVNALSLLKSLVITYLSSRSIFRVTLSELRGHNIVDPDFDTGGEAIAEMLEKGSNLTHLNLAWNLIRSDSARQLGEALNVNQTLVSLDLSYNAFGDAEARPSEGLFLRTIPSAA